MSLEIIAGPMFSGKCHGIDTPILLFDGTTKMVQDINRGEFLMGMDGEKVEVLSTCQGEGRLFKIFQSDGDSYVVNEDHVLSLMCVSTYSEDDTRGTVVDIPIKDYLFTVDEAFRIYYRGFRAIPFFDDRETFSVESAFEHAHNWGVSFIDIDDAIMGNHYSVRAGFLCGIIERFGRISNVYGYEIAISLKELHPDAKRNLLHLLRSLGIHIIEQMEEYHISAPDLHNFPFGPKFQEQVPRQTIPHESYSDLIIEEYGEGPYFGFTVSGNGRYLLGDYTVTHNTTELLRRIFVDAVLGERVLYINHSLDTRSETTTFSTHNPLYKLASENQKHKIEMISCSKLPSVDYIKEFDVIGIDEAQFFPDLQNAAKYADEAGKRVVVCGLSGDSNRKKFGKLLDLIPDCDEYVSLHAMCTLCAKKGDRVRAPFTFRTDNEETDQINVGAENQYIPLCRKHFKAQSQ